MLTGFIEYDPTTLWGIDCVLSVGKTHEFKLWAESTNQSVGSSILTVHVVTSHVKVQM
jgi:hypothetical protein